ETDSSVADSGTWSSWSDARNSGGSVKYSAATGAKATFTFTGACGAVMCAAPTSAGIATIKIDGSTVDSLDTLGSASVDFQQQKSDRKCVVKGKTLEVVVSGTKKEKSGGTVVFIERYIAQAPGATCRGDTRRDASA